VKKRNELFKRKRSFAAGAFCGNPKVCRRKSPICSFGGNRGKAMGRGIRAEAVLPEKKSYASK
jgi:hypothetical protein